MFDMQKAEAANLEYEQSYGYARAENAAQHLGPALQRIRELEAAGKVLADWIYPKKGRGGESEYNAMQEAIRVIRGEEQSK